MATSPKPLFTLPCVAVSTVAGFLTVFVAVLAAEEAFLDLHPVEAGVSQSDHDAAIKSLEKAKTDALETQKSDHDAAIKSLLADQTAKPGSNLEKQFGPNPCAGTKPKSEFDDHDCSVAAASEQAGADVTQGVQGLMETKASDGKPVKPVTKPLGNAGMCPVNVHWHSGAEHRSTGEYDENGKGYKDDNDGRQLGGAGRRGNQCYLYDKTDSKFTTEYDWKHCKAGTMHVGETYEVHWPHSAFGACGTPDQYQTSFYDGVFCLFGHPSLKFSLPSGGSFPPREAVAASIGVQAQVFVVVNDESYYYPNLMRGMIVDGDFGKDMAFYTGSTTGDKRTNDKCSSYSPITWQVDRKCHLISASSFDKMCADMKAQRDDMSDHLEPQGARMTTAPRISANNVVDGGHGGGYIGHN